MQLILLAFLAVTSSLAAAPRRRDFRELSTDHLSLLAQHDPKLETFTDPSWKGGVLNSILIPRARESWELPCRRPPPLTTPGSVGPWLEADSGHGQQVRPSSHLSKVIVTDTLASRLSTSTLVQKIITDTLKQLDWTIETVSHALDLIDPSL